jgi:thiamine biosynthesis lipoprotein
LPEERELERARGLVGWRMMKLDPASQTVTLEKPGIRLDLGGIAKGYAGDQAIAMLREHGIRSALFEAGGDIVVGDPPPGKEGWPIDIADAAGAPPKVVLSNCAISTSGDTVQFVVIDGKHYSHVVDPRTGVALTNRYAATIIAPRGIDTDALATAACVIGPDHGRALLPPYHAHGWIRQLP